jgi:hypothetical protein
MASSDPVHEYVQAVVQFVGANKRLEELKTMLRNAGEVLSDPQNAAVTGIPHPVPPEVAERINSKKIDGAKWPDPAAIRDAIVAHSRAQKAVENRWTLVPFELREAFQPSSIVCAQKSGQSE